MTLLLVACHSTEALAEMSDGRWHVGIGDATIYGWLTVGLYLLAAFVCFQKFGQPKRPSAMPSFWLYLSIFMLFLSINKQLDLQTWMTQVLRDHALAHGWYEKRRLVQIAFIGFLAISMPLILLGLRLFLRQSWQLYKLAWLGLVLLCTFVLIRAGSFHHVDIFINTQMLGVTMNVFLEIGALMIIIISAIKQDQPILNALAADTLDQKEVQIKDYVLLESEQAVLICPKCGQEPKALAAHGRLFKCKRCQFKYTVYIDV